MAKPNTVILALAVGVPEPNLTLLQIAAMVAEGVIVASPTITVTALDVNETLAVTVALPFLVAKEFVAIVASGVAVAPLVLTLVPLPVEVATVVETPLIRTEPKATLLAPADIADATVITDTPANVAVHDVVILDVEVTVPLTSLTIAPLLVMDEDALTVALLSPTT